jgi:hypothetical protein
VGPFIAIETDGAEDGPQRDEFFVVKTKDDNHAFLTGSTRPAQLLPGSDFGSYLSNSYNQVFDTALAERGLVRAPGGEQIHLKF